MAAKTSTKASPKTSTAKKGKTPKANPDKARSALVRAILATLTRTAWTPKADLLKAVAKTITKDQAIATYAKRIGAGEKDAVQVARGKAVHLMLTLITLVGAGKVEQDGRGDSKQYKLA